MEIEQFLSQNLSTIQESMQSNLELCDTGDIPPFDNNIPICEYSWDLFI